MLFLTRKASESVMIGHDDKLTVEKITNPTVHFHVAHTKNGITVNNEYEIALRGNFTTPYAGQYFEVCGIRIEVFEIRGPYVKICFQNSQDIPIYRQEIYDLRRSNQN